MVDELMAKLQEQLYPDAKKGCCFECKQPFSAKNIYSEAGAREAEISGLCEVCFDKMCGEFEDESSDDAEPAF